MGETENKILSLSPSPRFSDSKGVSIMKPKISQLLSEPGCDHNQKKASKKSCTKSAEPGAAAGGCAFDGAQITLVPITNAAHLVHGPIACLGNSWESRGSLSSGPQQYRTAFTTDISEHEIVFGGDKKLHEAILEIAKSYGPAAIFVYSTCIPALIGDDIDAVCKKASQEILLPVIPVHAPGFVGSKNLGNRLAGEALFEHVIGTKEPENSAPFDINLLGEYNIAGELWSVLPLFEELGIRIQASITGDGRYNDIASCHRAKLNVVICSKALITLARKMEEKFGIPYIEGSFYGISETSSLLRAVAQKLGDQDLIERTEGLIAREEACATAELNPYRERLTGKKAVLYTGGVKSWSMISAIRDVGMEIVATSTKKSTEEDKQRIKELLGSEGQTIEKGNPQELLKIIRETGAHLLMAGGRNQYTALKARIPFLDVNQERHHSYTGYEGVVNMARELDQAISSPVWEAVRRPAPWEISSGECGVRNEKPSSSVPPLDKGRIGGVSVPHWEEEVCD